MQKQPILIWNTVRSVWEKPQTENLLCEHLEAFSETWPTSGMMRNGQVFELPMQVLHTTDTESSSLPTLPTTRAQEPGSTSAGYGDSLNDFASRVTDGYARKDLLSTPKARDSIAEGYEAGLRRSQPQVGTIAKAIADDDKRLLLRTPAASEAERGHQPEDKARARGGQVTLSGQFLPTPNTMDHLPARNKEDIDFSKGGHRNVRETVVNELPTPTTRDYKDGSVEHKRDGKIQTDTVARAVFNSGEILPTTTASDWKGANHSGSGSASSRGISTVVEQTNWGKFEPAIKRWESVLGRPAPEPTKPDGKDGGHRLSARFTEWMMGVPEGWITDVGLSRNDELKACGNGVVPQQAELALTILLEATEIE